MGAFPGGECILRAGCLYSEEEKFIVFLLLIWSCSREVSHLWGDISREVPWKGYGSAFDSCCGRG